MVAGLTVAAIPHVLDDDEVPFVLTVVADPRRCLEVGNAEFRRGNDRCTLAFKLGSSWTLRAMLVESGGDTYLMASAGTVLNEWWPLVERHGANVDRPLLSACITQTAMVCNSDGVWVKVYVSPPSPVLESVSAVIKIGGGGGLSDDNLVLAHGLSLTVIKAALLVLGEYRTLLNPVPDVDVDVAGSVVPLRTMLDVAEQAAGAIHLDFIPEIDHH